MRILVAESAGMPDDVSARLGELGTVRLADLPAGSLATEIRDTEVLWTRLRHRVDQHVLDAAPMLRVVATPTTGLTHLDLDALAGRGIAVVSLKGDVAFLRSIRATTEHTMALMLAARRQLPAAVAHVTDGGWDRDCFRGRELAGASVVVLGYGRIGRQVAALLTAFQARVIAVDVDPAARADALAAGLEVLPLHDAIPLAEILTVHVDVRPETRNVIDASVLASLPSGAWLVNTARGELIDEAALCAALDSGHLGGVAVDVLAYEDAAGMASHPLVTRAIADPRVLITPHIAGNTIESRDRAERRLAEHLVHYLHSHTGT